MASLKSVALALAVCLFGLCVQSSTASADPAPHKADAARQKKKTAQRNAYLLKVMQNQGFSAAKAKSVVAALSRYEKDFRRVHKDMASARARLHDDSTTNDKVAQSRIDADKKQLERLKQRYQADISRTLTPTEKNKLAQILAPPKRKAKGKGHKKRKHKKQSQKRT
jgi:cytochrome c556